MRLARGFGSLERGFRVCRCIILPNKGENQKKVFARFLLQLPGERGTTGTVPKCHTVHSALYVDRNCLDVLHCNIGFQWQSFTRQWFSTFYSLRPPSRDSQQQWPPAQQ